MIRRYLIVLLVLVSTVVGVQAQDVPEAAPIIALSKGDFWAINPDDGTVTQITHHKQDLDFFQPFSQLDLALSSDGHYLAYLKTPLFFAIAMRNNLFGDLGEYPTDIVLLDLRTGKEKVIAPQQANVKYSDWQRLWYRANLIWSPDGSQLAYYQHRGTTVDTYQSQAMIYNLAADKTVQLDAHAEGIEHEIAWLPEGIGVGSTLYDANGKVLAQHKLNDWVFARNWATYRGQSYKVVDTFGYKLQAGQTFLMNALTGQFSRANGYQAAVSLTHSENSLMLIGDLNNGSVAYVLDPQTGNRFVPPVQDTYAFSYVFSPDGKQVAYILSKTGVVISDLKDKNLTADLLPTAIVWGNKQYTVASESGDQAVEAEPTTYFDTNPYCGGLLPVGLVAGGQGRVVMGGSSNRIRRDPFTASDVLAMMPGGTVFKVVDGSQTVCNDEIRWVQVEYNGIVGWTAEGANGEVFLEVVQ
jgi:hypothetical protein